MTRVILITGANSGVGYAISNLLSIQPDSYVLLGSRNSSKGEEAVSKIKSTHPNAAISCILLDVDDEESIKAAAKQVTDKFGKLDVLINNAGIYNPNATLEDNLTRSFRTNFTGAALTTAHFKDLLLKGENPYLLYTSSGLGSIATAFDASSAAGRFVGLAYRASKTAMNMMAVEDHKALGPQGVKVFPFCPGLVESNLRGTSPEAITAGGNALSADTSAVFVKDVLDGKRDGDVGKFIHVGGIYGW